MAEEGVEATVVAPVPWFPFKAAIFGRYGRSARAPLKEHRNGVTIYHPRYLVIPKVGMILTPKFMAWSAVRCIRRLLKSGLTFDVIDAHYLFPDGIVAAELGKAFNKPFIMTARGSDVTEIGQFPGPRKMIQYALAAASHTVTVSNNLRTDLIAMGGEERRITTLRNGVDLERFSEKNREANRKIFGGGPILLFAGWLIPRKRLDLVLQVTVRIPKLRTVIVGDGPLKEQLMGMCKELEISDRVIFAGQKQPEEMADYYSAADILLLPSDREGWANVLLEAMACGTPVVTRAVGGAPDFITKPEAGRVVDSDKPDALTAAVVDLLKKSPKRAATRAFAEKFDWRSTSAGQEKIFRLAIESHGYLEK